LVIKALRTLIVDHFIVFPLVGYYVLYPGFKYFGMPSIHDPIPNPLTIMIQFIFFLIGVDTTFYWSHRLLHHPLFYKHIHKKHHEFKQSVGIAAEYSHPIEGLLNFISTVGPVIVSGCHLFTFVLFILIRIEETVESHSGYNFPFSVWSRIMPALQGGADRHEFHHSHNKGNFGMFAVWDYVCGTDQAYWEWKKKEQKSE